MIGSLDDLPPHLRTAIRGELLPHETLLWVGRPDLAAYVRSYRRAILGVALPMLILGAAFCVPVYLQIGAFRDPRLDATEAHDAELAFFVDLLWPVAIIGLVLLSFVAWTWRQVRVRRRDLRNTAFTLTGQRALVIKLGDRRSECWSYDPGKFSILCRFEQRDGSGSILFSPSPRQSAGRFTVFHGIGRVRDVERLLLMQFGHGAPDSSSSTTRPCRTSPPSRA